MYPRPYLRRGPGGRPSPILGWLDRQRVAKPWVWNGLCNAIAPLDGTLRDWVNGAAPSLYSTATPGRDIRGGEVLAFTGSSAQYQEFAPTGLQALPSSAITVYCRFRFNGTAPGQGGIFSKPYATTSPFDTWLIQGSGAGSNLETVDVALSVGGSITSSSNSADLGFALFTNIWMRWTSGSTITCDMLRDDGTVAATQLATATVTGSISYPGTPLPIRVGGLETVARASIGGEFSVGMVWNRSLANQEMYAITADPFGFLRRT